MSDAMLTARLYKRESVEAYIVNEEKVRAYDNNYPF